MKLFENKVGRPSNDILMKRRLFMGGVIGFALIIMFSSILAIKSFNASKLGAAVAASVGNNKSYCDFYYKIVSKNEIKILADCIGDAYPETVKIYDKLSLKDAYINQNKRAVSHWEYPFKIPLKSKKNYKLKFKVAHAESNKTESGSTNIKLTNISKKSSTKKSISLICPDEVLVNEEFTCTVKSSGVSVLLSENGLAKGYNKSVITRKDNLEIKAKYETVGNKEIKAAKGSIKASKTIIVK